jgi:hypothetical protein
MAELFYYVIEMKKQRKTSTTKNKDASKKRINSKSAGKKSISSAKVTAIVAAIKEYETDCIPG